MKKNKFVSSTVILGLVIIFVQTIGMNLLSGDPSYNSLVQLTLLLPSTTSNIISEILQTPSPFMFLMTYILSFVFAFILVYCFKKISIKHK